MKKNNKIEYTPSSQLSHPVHLIKAMVHDLWNSRGLAYRLLIRNIQAQYRQTVFGYLWALMPPLFTAFVWIYLKNSQVVEINQTEIPYPLYVVVGMVLWQTFVDAINSPLKLVQESKSMLAKINFPREALVIAGIGEVVFNLGFRILIVGCALIWFNHALPPTVIFAPFGIIVLIFAGLAIGIILTPLGVLYTDIGRGIIIVTQIWLYLTPVIYPLPPGKEGSLWTMFNPATPLITTTRDWITTGATLHLSGFIFFTILFLFLLLFGWVLYRIAMPHLISRISA